MKRNSMAGQSLLTVREVAKYLRCHEHTVRRWIWEGKVASVKVGDLVRVPRAELERMTGADAARHERKPKRCTARDLLEALRRFRERLDPEDVRDLNRRMREGEQPADWSSPIA